MKKLLIALAVTTAAVSTAAQAAHFTFTGIWNGMQTWNPGQTGSNTISTTQDGGPDMAVSGRLTIDDITGEVTSLRMQQAAENTLAWDAGYDTVTMAGYAWRMVGNTLRLDYGATATCNGADKAACGPGYEFGGNYMGYPSALSNFGAPLNALTDWIGAENYAAYGDIIDGLGVTATVNGNLVTLDTVTSWPGGFIPLAATGQYILTTSPIPIPAGAWLFGSALLGLVGIGKKRKAA
ncbi:MAG: hypothetical protein KDI14_10500 [Halioglobus sp.]|nr:hypothetical protein [Halioglobus sp.]